MSVSLTCSLNHSKESKTQLRNILCLKFLVCTLLENEKWMGTKKALNSKLNKKKHPGAAQGKPIGCVPAEETTIFLQKCLMENTEGLGYGRS